MSKPFAFPPPPPPPPKRLPQPDQYQSQHAVSYRGGYQGRGSFRGQSFAPRGGSFRGRGGPNNTNSARGTAVQHHTRHKPLHAYHQSAAPKRDYATAFPATSIPNSKPKAPPAVPSFNLDVENLISKKPSLPSTSVKSKTNVLGLTPSRDEPGSESDGEEDEASLAAAAPGQGMSFEHRGQTLSLRTPEEITAWLAERRSKFPTQAKADAARQEAEQKKRQWEEQKRAKAEAARTKHEQRQAAWKEREKDKLRRKMIDTQVAKAKAAVADVKSQKTGTARSKAEKLRQRAEKLAQELKVAEEAAAEAEANANGCDVDGLVEEVKSNSTNLHAKTNDEEDVHEDLDGLDAVLGSGLDDTSSSGSSIEDNGSDSAPEEASSHRDGAEIVAPRPQNHKRPSDGSRELCRVFIKTGKCKFGRKCRYSHRVQNAEGGQKRPGVDGKSRRKGLYQIMVEKEKEDQHRRAVKAIIALGERGLLKEPGDIDVQTTHFDPETAPGNAASS